jgi:hypothetical protein
VVDWELATKGTGLHIWTVPNVKVCRTEPEKNPSKQPKSPRTARIPSIMSANLCHQWLTVTFLEICPSLVSTQVRIDSVPRTLPQILATLNSVDCGRAPKLWSREWTPPPALLLNHAREPLGPSTLYRTGCTQDRLSPHVTLQNMGRCQWHLAP